MHQCGTWHPSQTVAAGFSAVVGRVDTGRESSTLAPVTAAYPDSYFADLPRINP